MREVELCPAGVCKNQEVFDHYPVRRVRQELFDLRADPAELDNRIDDPACAEALADLRAALDVHLEAIGGALEHVDKAADGPEWGWKGVREAQRRSDPNLKAVIALGE